MATKRNRKKSNLKRQMKITFFLINGIGAILLFVLYFTVYYRCNGIDQVIFWFLGVFILPIVSLIVYAIFFANRHYEEQFEEENKHKKAELIPYLSKNDFTEIHFDLKDYHGDAIDMVKQILQKEECKFYAKLAENDNVIIIAKDKHNEEVYKKKIENLLYIDNYFKIKDSN